MSNILDSILHYGVKRRSGRYAWGSGDDPRSKGASFLNEYQTLKSKGLSEMEIASSMGINTTQLRNNITYAHAEETAINRTRSKALKESGMTNTAIGEALGVSEGTVRNYLSEKDPSDKNRKMQIDNVSDAIKAGVDKTGYLDVGVGVERQLGVPRNKFNTVVSKLAEEDGYTIHEIYVKRLNDPTKFTTVKVLTKEQDLEVVKLNSEKIRPLDSWSDDNGLTVQYMRPPEMVDLKRIKVRYKEDGGEDKDGLIELRPGVKDLDMGASKYAQVRIGAGDNLYLKGMAAYSTDKFPDGVDIIFNTNKTKDVPTEKVLKKMNDDPENPFGANIKPGGQKGALNIVNEEGDWDTWSTKMSSQFLSKQSTSLIKERLDATYAKLKSDFDEINTLTNPVVKKHLMEDYISGLDSKAKQLKALGLPRTKNHVLLPVNDLKENEIFAPNYKNGERVVLVRHPHGGAFEIPQLIVNNKNKTASDMIGKDSPDAVGIHPTVAKKLSGADFDGDTALVIPNTSKKIKVERSLSELKNFDAVVQYKVDKDSPANMHKLDKETGKRVNTGKTIAMRTKEIQMGEVSNLITDMTIKGASNSEIARAVKHSMVVIDSEKHNLNYKQSAIDNGISALRKKYQTHINPDTGKQSRSASTLISRSKGDIETVNEDGSKTRKSKINISDPDFNPDKYTSGTAREQLYSNYIKGIQGVKNEANKAFIKIPRPGYSKDAARIYEPEVKSLNAKLHTALLNAPKERQAQLLTNNLYYTSLKPDMDKDDKRKLRQRSLAKARVTVGASGKNSNIVLSEKEWEAIQSRAISTTKLNQILNNADMNVVKKMATPRKLKMTTAKATRAQALLNNGYTYAEVATALGVSTSSIREVIKNG